MSMKAIKTCPTCQSNKILMTNFEVDAELCTREVRCYACGQVWSEVFEPSSFTLLDKLPLENI